MTVEKPTTFVPSRAEAHVVRELTIPSGAIAEEQAQQIRDLIWNAHHQIRLNGIPADLEMGRDHNAFPSDDFPEDFWEWKTNRGTFPKRLANWVKKVYGIKLDSDLLGKIGCIAGQAQKDGGKTYFWDIDYELDWNAGDFGDGPSCFWTERRGALPMMRDAGCFAFRCFRRSSYGGFSGTARAWVYPYGPNAWIMFNGYGYNTLLLARLWATITGSTYKKIELVNWGTRGGELWINGDGAGYGYVIGSVDFVADFPGRYDLQIDEQEGDGYACYRCGYGVDVDYAYHDDNGNVYCEECWCEIYTTCDQCHEDIYRDYAMYMDETTLCEYCYDDQTSTCNECGTRAWDDDMVEVNGGWYCDSCAVKCDECCEWVLRYDTKRNADGHRLCPECLNAEVENEQEGEVQAAC